MEEPVVRYFHATLYQFNKAGQAAVIDKFRTAIQNVQVQCWYDDEHHMFAVECSASLGTEADQALSHAIDCCLLEQSESKEPPKATRFSESVCISLARTTDADEEDDEAGDLPTQRMRQPLIDHSIVSNAQAIQCFVLTELEDKSLLERILAPRTPVARKILSEAFTCRAVRFNQKERRYVFDGATQGVPPSIEVANTFFDGVHFPVLGDRPQQAGHSQRTYGHRHKDLLNQDNARAPPIVSDWLAGIGGANMIEPEVNKEVPSDAKKLLFGNINSGNRPRVPKGVSLQLVGSISGPSPPVADDPAEIGASDGDAFNALLGSNADGSSSGATEYITGSEHSSGSPVGSIVNFDDIFADTKENQTDENAIDHQHGPGSTTRAKQQKSNPLPAFESTRPHVDDHGALSAARSADGSKYPFQDPPSYGKEFALVDRIGLTASAASTARWEIENNVRTARKPKQRSVVLRPIVNRNMPTATALTVPIIGCEEPAGSGRPMPSSSDQVGTESSHTIQDHPFQLKNAREPAAAIRPGHSRSQEGQIRTEGILTFAPSFTQKFNTMNQKAGPRGSRKKKNTAAKGNAISNVVLPRPDPIPSKQAKKVASSAEVAGRGPPPKGKHQPTSGVQVGATHQGKQRTAPNLQDPLQQDLLRDTKEATQVQEYQSSKMASLVERILQKQAANLLNSFEESESDSDDDNPLPSDLCNFKIKAEIGLVFTFANDGVELIRKVQNPLEFHSVLRNGQKDWKSFFLRRVTTSADDVAFVVNLCPETFSLTAQEVVYELHLEIRTEKETYSALVKYNPSGRGVAYSVVSCETIHCNYFMHFPEHVWDARMLLISEPVEYDLTEEIDASVREFLEMLQTEAEPPSFRGRYRCGVIRLHQIFAKRILTYTSGEISFLVTEIRDLVLHIDALGDFHAIYARAGSQQEQLDEQRTWIEARFETRSLSELNTMRDLVKNMVERMDGVGMRNQGPCVYNPPPPSEASNDGHEAVRQEIEW